MIDIILDATIKNRFAIEANEPFIFDITFNKQFGSGTISSGGSIPIKHNHQWADIKETPNTFPPTKHLHSLSDVNSLPESINSLTNEVSEINDQLVGLQAGAILIGTVNYDASELTNEILHAMSIDIRTNVKIGYTIIGNDGIRWWCEEVSSDGATSQWNNIGQSMVGKATNQTEGLVKGSTENNKISMELDGTMKVNNVDAEKVNSLSEYINNKIDKVTVSETNLLTYSGGETIAMTNWTTTKGYTNIAEIQAGEELYGKECFKMQIANEPDYATLEQMIPITDLNSTYTLYFWHKNNVAVSGQISVYIIEYDITEGLLSSTKQYESPSQENGWAKVERTYKIKNRGTHYVGVQFRLSLAGPGWEQLDGYIADIILEKGDSTVWHPNKDKYVLRTGGTFVGKIFAPAFGRLSDMRLKENISPISDNAMEQVRNLTAVEYNFIDGSEISYGFIAQEVEKYFPDTVSKNEDGYKSIDYDQIQNIQIAYLMKKITELENKINTLNNGKL